MSAISPTKQVGNIMLSREDTNTHHKVAVERAMQQKLQQYRKM